MLALHSTTAAAARAIGQNCIRPMSRYWVHLAPWGAEGVHRDDALAERRRGCDTFMVIDVQVLVDQGLVVFGNGIGMLGVRGRGLDLLDRLGHVRVRW